METVKKNEFAQEYKAPKAMVVNVNVEKLLCASGETGEVPPGQEGGFDD